MVIDNIGTKYATIAAAVQAYTANSNIGPLKRLHAGTLPAGWTYDDKTGELRYTSVVVVSDEERTLVAVPAACTADRLIDTSNRYVGDELMVYIKDEGYYTWTLDENEDWKPSLTFVTLEVEEEPSVNSTAASDVDLAPGQAVWLTRTGTSKNSPIKLLVVPTGDPVQVAVDKGWNLVAPMPKANGAAFDAKTELFVANEGSFDTGDQIVVPTAAAPKTFERRGEKWMVLKEPEEASQPNNVPTGWGPISDPVWTVPESIPIPAGKGFWFNSKDKNKRLQF